MLKVRFSLEKEILFNLNNFNHFFYVESKIGRQSNLFKQKLKHHIAGKHENSTDKDSNLISSSSNASLSSGYISPEATSSYSSMIDIEDTLDSKTGNLIRNIYHNFNKYLEVIFLIYIFALKFLIS
jgi:hypothetical protein